MEDGSLWCTDSAAAVVEAGREILYRALRVKNRLARVHLRGTHIRQPGATVRLCGRKHIVVAKAAVVWPIAESAVGIATHAGVAAGDEDGHALEGELEELVALPLLVVGWEIVLVHAIGYCDDVCGRVDAAL